MQANVVTYRDISASPTSEDALSLVRGWINVCDSEHSECPSNIGRPLPARLVAVGLDSGRVRLVLTHGQCGTYAALSYCWGGKQSSVARQANIKAMMSGINLDDLPKTQADAIMYARLLKIPYIWIDSLCIIQDDPEDWVREAAAMWEIYSNARLTLAAFSAENAFEGFLGPRELRLPHPQIAVVPTVYGQSINPALSVSVYVRPRTSGWDLKRKPLEERAWCLQEKVLSNRLLYFTNEQMLWECATESRLESDKEPHPLKDRWSFGGYYEGYDWKGFFADRREENLRRSHNNIPQYYSAWRSLTVEYSQRHLSHESDRLPALSGLAHRFHNLYQDKYYAGVWSGHIREGLAWRRAQLRTSPMITGGPANSNTEHAIAASWSWAAHPFSISYPGDDSEGDTQFGPASCVIDHIETWPISSDPFGQVSGGKLVLRGLQKMVSIPLPSPSFAWFDDGRDSDAARPCEYSCFLLGVNVELQYNYDLQYAPIALIIELVPGRSESRRIGIVSFFIGKSWWDPHYLDDWQRNFRVTLI